MTEQEARKLLMCPVCGKPKTTGAVVCWGNCYRGKNGYKYSSLPFEMWYMQKLKEVS